MAEEWLLIVDCSGDEALVAVARGNELVTERRVAGRRSSEELLPAVREELRAAGVGIEAVGLIGAVRGPGSFTGVRVGLSAAKGLSEGLGVPLVAVSRFAVVAQAAGVLRGTVVLDAGRGEWYWGRVEGGSDGEQGVGTKEEVCGELREGEPLVCLEREAQLWPGAVCVPRASAAAAVAVMRRERARGEADTALLDGLYLWRTEAELLERQRRHRAEAEGRE